VQADEIAAIEQLKYAYFRLLDTKEFVKLSSLLTEDATTAYESGAHTYRGRDAIVAFLASSLSDPEIVHVHNGHHPEIVLTGDVTATGTWYLEDKVIMPAYDLVVEGAAFYSDDYVKIDGEWKIAHTGYERIYEERRKHVSVELISFTSRFAPSTAA